MDVNLLIDNLDRPASDGKTFVRYNPFDGEIATRAAAATVEDAIAAVESAAAAFTEWADMGPGERRRILNRAADLFEERADTFMEIMVNETGAAPSWAQFNARLAAGNLREAASMTYQVRGEILPTDKKNYLSMIQRFPSGVCLAIAPWNAPLVLSARAIAMPLACGNTIVMKTSEISPGTQVLFGKLMHEAGLPKGVLNVLTVAPEDNPKVIEAMIKHPAVRHVNFTGSSRVGSIIGETCGRYLTPVLLELGGKAPFLVLEDADLDDAVAAASFGAFMHQGQICMSTEKLIVDESVADDFVDKLVTKANSLSFGDPRKEKVALGSMVDRKAAVRTGELIEEAVARGAKLVAGGNVEGTIVNATVLDNVTSEMRIYHEESFGPVVAIIRVKDSDEAIRIANDTEYGLAAAIFGKDITRALAIAKRIDTGACHINGPTVQDEAHVPLGGVKSSGYGRFHGLEGIFEFTDTRWVTIGSSDSHHYPI